jgi:mannose-6-phosphate isomerase
MDGNTNDSPYDVGMLLVFLLELRYVKKGETIYLQPGVPHSYLSGRGLEVAENSNNTIRIGLSNKPSNKKEFSLLAKKEEVPLHCLTASITPRGSIEYSHQGFGLTLQEYNVERGSKVAAFESTSPSIWLLIEGEVRVGAQQHFCEAGCAFYQKPYEISSFEAQEDTRLFRVSVA